MPSVSRPLGFLSPNGQFFVTTNYAEPTADGGRKYSWAIRSAIDGSEKIVLAEETAQHSSPMSWTEDSRGLLFSKLIGNGEYELWEMFLDGTASKRIVLRVDGSIPNNAHVHPDGKRIAFSVSKPLQSQIWAMENFLPPAKDPNQNK